MTRHRIKGADAEVAAPAPVFWGGAEQESIKAIEIYDENRYNERKHNKDDFLDLGVHI